MSEPLDILTGIGGAATANYGSSLQGIPQIIMTITTMKKP
jgi:hypothetical protein